VTLALGSLEGESPIKSQRKRTNRRKDERRRHHHYLLTIYYSDGERFARMYTDREKARSFATRQKKSPVVKRTRVAEIS
jgi:hypothetical protein